MRRCQKLSMVAKLVDLYNTKYFYKTFVVDLNYLFNTITRLQNGEDFTPNVGNDLLGGVYEAAKRGEKVIIDLADARITSDAAASIMHAVHRGIKFCDTRNEWRDVIMKENTARHEMELVNVVTLPIFDYRTNIKEYVKGLDPSAYYEPKEQPAHILIALVCIITILRPSINVLVNPVLQGKLFKYINTKVSTADIIGANEFYMYSPEGIQIVTRDNIYVQEAQRYLQPREALQYVTLIPTEFGKEVLLHNPAYQGLFRSCLLLLQEFQESSSKTLEEIYT